MQEMIAQTANQFTLLVESGKKSTDGQTLLNFVSAHLLETIPNPEPVSPGVEWSPSWTTAESPG